MVATWGIDVASEQHPAGAPIDFGGVRGEGIGWAAVKVSEGDNYTNPFAPADVGGFAGAGLEVVEYHFARPSRSSATAEAALAAHARGPLVAGRRYALDLEDGLPELGAAKLAAWTTLLIATLPLNLIYTDDSYRQALKPFGYPWGLQTWLADPSNRADRAGCAVVQVGTVGLGGIAALVDLDLVFAL